MTAVENWRPRIDSVANCLLAWHSRSLSFRGREFVLNALALARIWYVAALIPVPQWVICGFSHLAFSFFWGGKRDLVCRDAVVQPHGSGGFGAVSVSFKVWTLHVKWVRHFFTSFLCWMQFLLYYCREAFGSWLGVVLLRPYLFDLSSLPPFYRGLLSAWVAAEGSFSVTRESLIMGSFSCESPIAVAKATTKSVYSLHVANHSTMPNCVRHFAPLLGALYWHSTWDQLFWFPLDCPVIDLAWLILHGLLHTAHRLVITFSMVDVPLACFCSPAVSEMLDHPFFYCPLAHSILSWLQALMLRCFALVLSLACRRVLFGFNQDELLCVPRIFDYMLNVCKFFLWQAGYDYRFCDVAPIAADLLAKGWVRVQFHLPLFFKCFLSAHRRRFYVRQWGACGVVASIVDGDFVVHL